MQVRNDYLSYSCFAMKNKKSTPLFSLHEAMNKKMYSGKMSYFLSVHGLCTKKILRKLNCHMHESQQRECETAHIRIM